MLRVDEAAWKEAPCSSSPSFSLSLIAGFFGLSNAAAGIAKILSFAAAAVFVALVAPALFAGSVILRP